MTAVCTAATLTVTDVIKMSEAGVNDDVVIQTLQSSGTVFQLSPQDIDALKHSGVSNRVVAAMQGKPVPATSVPKAGGAPPSVVHEPSGRDYIGGMSSQPVVKALPPDPPVYAYVAAPPPGYCYPSYPYPVYYGPGPCYYGPRVGFYFGYGRWHRCR